MEIRVEEATGKEWLEEGHKQMLNVRMSVEEGEILRAILRNFQFDIALLRGWDEELDDAGIQRPDNIRLAAKTDGPVLFFYEKNEPKQSD